MALFCVLIGGGIAYKACFTSRKVKNNQELLTYTASRTSLFTFKNLRHPNAA